MASSSKKKAPTTYMGSETAIVQMVTSKQAAEMCGVSQARIRQWVMDGRLKSYPITAKFAMYRLAEVQKLADEPRRPGRPKGS
jgi:hypothetical protein